MAFHYRSSPRRPFVMGLASSFSGFGCGGRGCACSCGGKCRSPGGAGNCGCQCSSGRSAAQSNGSKDERTLGYVGKRGWRSETGQLDGWRKRPTEDNVAKHMEKVLTNYVNRQIRRRKPFYISPELNYDPKRDDFSGFGFFPFIAAILATVTAALPTVAAAASTLYTIKALNSQGQQPPAQSGVGTLTDQVVADLQARGIQLPDAQAQQMITGNTLSPGNQQFLLIGGLALVGAILVLK